MKTTNLLILTLLLTAFLTGCGSAIEEIRDYEEAKLPTRPDPPVELILSLDDKEVRMIEGLDTEFFILQGNGGYTVSTSWDKIARAEIVDDRVLVSFIANGQATIKVTDKEGKTAETTLEAFDESINLHGYGTSVQKGEVLLIKDMDFGAGGYTFRNQIGTSVKVEIDNDIIKLTGMEYGTTRFDLVDRRGSVLPMNVGVYILKELTSSRLDMTMGVNQSVIISIQYGEGDWEIATHNESMFRATMMRGSDYIPGERNALQLDTYDAIGQGHVILKDKAGYTAIIYVDVDKNYK